MRVNITLVNPNFHQISLNLEHYDSVKACSKTLIVQVGATAACLTQKTLSRPVNAQATTTWGASEQSRDLN